MDAKLEIDALGKLRNRCMNLRRTGCAQDSKCQSQAAAVQAANAELCRRTII